MKYCPECDAEYEDDVSRCADCELALISEAQFQQRNRKEESEREAMAAKEFVPVKTAANRFEADRFRSALEQEGFSVLIRPFTDTAYDGIYVRQKGWGYVEVPRSMADKAEPIVRALEASFDTNEEAQDPEKEV